jgi:hypothetical protein
MAGMKKLINRTGKDLKVVLTVRKGDHPLNTAGTVEVELSASKGTTGIDARVKDVSYGNDVDIYLNGIETSLIFKGDILDQRQIVVERGKGLDNALNTNDTIEFLFDGKQVLISATNSTSVPFLFPAAV